MSRVLVVDDKEMMRDSVATTLARAGFDVVTAEGGEAALGAIASARPDVVVTDLKMPNMTGVELIERVRAIDDEIPIVMMTAFATVETAVRAVKAGAYDYLTKPFEGDQLLITVKRAIQHGRLTRENAILRDGATTAQPARGGTGLDRIIGESPAIRRVKEQVLALAESQGNVLIVGESGTGKEVVARAIHELSPRKGAAYLAVNCAALSESLLESELFGHEKGAFTGAEKLRKGRFELADRGTLLLDEISEIGAPIQAKLLRVLQERAFERVGSSTTIGVDVRVIATSNRDLPQSVARGQFRQDLFFRLNVLPVHLPPLRDRLEDVPALAGSFVAAFCAREGRAGVRFDPGALELLQSYNWPGNVRELQNICERAVVLCATKGAERTVPRSLLEPWLTSSAPITQRATQVLEAKPITLGAPAEMLGERHNGHALTNGRHATLPNGDANGHHPETGYPSSITREGGVRLLEDVERDVIVSALRRFNGHRQKTAKALGIGVRTLGLKLKKWKEENLVAQSL
jgi:DNA-binding NtrC family response regulator